jgi:hypothetical protein
VLVCEEMVAVMEPQEIEDEEHEQVLERVAAVDVAKASGMVCTRVPNQAHTGKRRTRVWQVDATTNAMSRMPAGTAPGRSVWHSHCSQRISWSSSGARDRLLP